VRGLWWQASKRKAAAEQLSRQAETAPRALQRFFKKKG
jgi:hypothetical protein